MLKTPPKLKADWEEVRMLRDISANLATILPAARIRHTLDLHLADGNTLFLSRGEIARIIDEKTESYSNWIKSVSEFNYSIDAPIDRVTITCQNVNGTLGLYLASDLRKLDHAFAKYSRQYQSIRTPGLIEDDVDQFRCVLANAEADETEVKFELIVDFEAIGDVLASRSLSPRCPWPYKNGIECTATGSQTTCPKNREACKERHTSKEDHEFGGWEFFQDNPPTPPSSPGNTFPSSCFPAKTLVWTPKGFVPIEEIKIGDEVYSWNKISKQIEIKKVWKTFHHENIRNLYDFDFGYIKFSPTPEHKISTREGMIAADKFDLNKTKLSIYDIRWLNRENYKNGWQLASIKSMKNNSDVNCDTYNFAVEDFATYFVGNTDSNYVAAVSNLKSPSDPENPEYPI